ncbi:MAG TPA: hypothetical protein ENI15_17155 [Spirochaetes bacterium]|nr:hypothetical protein [Spirochaetota bacterium]
MQTFDPIIKKPEPDFSELTGVLKGEIKPLKVYPVELSVDEEILSEISEMFLGKKWVIKSRETLEEYYRQKVDIYFRLGYDGVLEGMWRDSWINHPALGSTKTEDTAGKLSRGQREWANEGVGIIDSWESFEAFPWDKISADYEAYEMMARHLPDGMMLYASSSLYEHVQEIILGYRGIFYKIYDEPELVKAVFDRWGALVLDFYKNIVDFDSIGAIWHADDLGYTTTTHLSPEHFEEYVFPWIRKYASVTHEHGKMFMLHACGNFYNNGIIETLINDIGVDVIHSFQDTIIPIPQALEKYGSKIAMIGGVDVDNLCRMHDVQLREYCQNILAQCMPKRFAFGSGNTVTNYVPLENYLIMLDEGRKWKG